MKNANGRLRVLASIAILLTPYVCSAGVGDVIPRPQVVRMRTSSSAFQVTSQTAIVLSEQATSADSLAATYLQTEIASTLGFSLTIRKPTGADANTILLGTRGSGDAIASATDTRRMSVTSSYPGPDGYVLDVGAAGVVIAGSDGPGTFYGAVTLAQLLANDGSRVDGMTVVDHPDLPDRMIYLRPNLQVDSRADETVDLMVEGSSYKMNRAVIADFKFNLLDAVSSAYWPNVARVKQTSVERFMPIVPAIGGPGYGEGVLRHNPNLAEGMLSENAVFVSEGSTARFVPDPSVSLSDGGFESPNGNSFPGWSWQDLPGTRTFADFSTKRSGSSSVRLQDFTVGASHGNARIVANISVKPYRNYLLTVYAKSQDLSSSANILALGFSNVEGPSSLAHEAFGFRGTNDWTKLEVNFNSLRHSEIGIYLGVWGGGSGTLWFDDAELQEIALVNVLRREGTPLTVTSVDGHVLEEGVDYEPVADPLLGNVPYAGIYTKYHTPPSLQPIPGGGIAEGDTLLVSFYHPVMIYGYQVAASIVEPETYAIYDKIMDDVLELFEPDKLMLGHDEIRVMNQDLASKGTGMTPAEQLGDHMHRLVDMLHEKRSDLEVWVWSDMFDPFHNARNNYYLVDGDLSGVIDLIPEELKIVNWNRGEMVSSVPAFDSKGFRQFASNDATSSVSASPDWGQAMRDAGGGEGMMFTTWDGTYDDLGVVADYAWSMSPYVSLQPISISGGATTVEADVSGDGHGLPGPTVKAVSLFWREGDTGSWIQAGMSASGQGRYSASVASTAPSFYIRAEDSAGNVQLAPPRAPDRYFTPAGLSSAPVSVSPEAARSDFDGDGSVNFNDFLAFAGAFGSSEAAFDLSGDGKVDFSDFLLFAQDFGKQVR